MDNFTIWVDAPSEALIETPSEEESTGFLRDEILQTQQYVIEKLDEQKYNEEKNGDNESSEKTQRLAENIEMEGEKTRNASREVDGFKQVCKANELRLITIKNDFPRRIESDDKHEKILMETRNELFLLESHFASHQKTAEVVLTRGCSRDKGDIRKECEKLRSSILEAKQKHENLKSLQLMRSQLEKKYEEDATKNRMETEKLQKDKDAQQNDEECISRIQEECVKIRTELTDLEFRQAKSSVETNKKEVESLHRKTSEARLQSVKLNDTLSKTKKEIEEAREQLKATEKEEIETENLIKEKKKAMMTLLNEKVVQAKEKIVKGSEKKKIVALKNEVNKKKKELEKSRKEFEKANLHKKSLSELIKEVKSIDSKLGKCEIQYREFMEKDEKLLKQIHEMTGSSSDSDPSIRDMNDTVDLAEMEEYEDSEYGEPIIAPKPKQKITPIRHISHDIFADNPVMTSTPLSKPDSSMRTRAAARRLEQTANVKTAEIQKKRGGRK